MSKSLKKTLLIVGIAAAVCAAVWGRPDAGRGTPSAAT